ncbi:hypothetical protein BKA70DRAFT_1430776 [Coprinopsis sp. MPI-PUGE-AT-0042]|nr:hypothetical protein BKA70DRAFT_1430776 [Coprinopsis sp. MPI-PUGE-AT-0042]
MSILPNTNTQQTKVRSFLRSIHRQHFPPPARQHGLRQVLEFCALSKGLRIWDWPVYDRDDLAVLRDPSLLNCRVAPSDLETYRRYHQLLNPCCFCAFLDGVPYTESHVGIALAEETAQDGKQGLYVAECASGRCGYSVRLEEFYPLIGLRLKKYGRRGCALTYEESRTLHGVEAKVAQTCRKRTAGTLEDEDAEEYCHLQGTHCSHRSFSNSTWSCCQHRCTKYRRLDGIGKMTCPNSQSIQDQADPTPEFGQTQGVHDQAPEVIDLTQDEVPVFDVIDLTQDEVPVFDVIDLTQDEVPVFDVIDLTQDEVPVFEVIDLTQDEIPVFDVVDLTQDVGLALEVTG